MKIEHSGNFFQLSKNDADYIHLKLFKSRADLEQYFGPIRVWLSENCNRTKYQLTEWSLQTHKKTILFFGYKLRFDEDQDAIFFKLRWI